MSSVRRRFSIILTKESKFKKKKKNNCNIKLHTLRSFIRHDSYDTFLFSEPHKMLNFKIDFRH